MCLSSRMLNGKTLSFSTVRNYCPENKRAVFVLVSRLSHRHLPLLLSYATVSGFLLKLPLLHSVLRSLSSGPVPSLSLSFLSLLRRSGYMPLDNYSVSIALSTAARLPSVVVGAQLHALSVKLGLVMIMGFAVNGLCGEALDLFARMEEEGEVMLNEITFLGVLTSCSHEGLVEQGYNHFQRMSKIYSIAPRIEHYGCMVDLLGRAKLLAEAEQFIREMPIAPDVVIWRSLLFACRACEEVGLAENVAERIQELEPKWCGGHVLLSNVYSTTSRWVDVNKVRTGMDSSRMSKRPGCSSLKWTDVCMSSFQEMSHILRLKLYTTFF